MAKRIPLAVRQVCSLSTDDLQERLAMIRREIRPYVQRAAVLTHGMAFEFKRQAQLQTQLENLVELERQCCGGLTFDLQLPSDADILRLTVTGADPYSGVFEPFGGPAGSL